MGEKTETHNIILKAGTKLLDFRPSEFQFLCEVLLPLREPSFHLSKFNFESDPLFPQLLGFRALLVLQALPLVHLTFEVRVTPFEFGVGIFKLVLLVLDTVESQRLAFEGGLEGGRLRFEVLYLFLESRDVILLKVLS